MATDLSDAAILRHVENALREVGEGRASLALAGERLIRNILGLPMPDPMANPATGD